MQPHSSTTPFWRRSLSLARVASHATAKARSPDKAVHKWHVFRAICSSKARIGAPERALAVPDALLSFHPETTLSGEGLFVFPSNQLLALRARGIAPATLRRHKAALVNCGLTIRHDNPNGKRFASTGQDGTIEMAFGFDRSPLVARAEEFEAWAEDVLAEERALRLVRERNTFCRRDIAKMIATGVEEGVPTRRAGEGPFDWSEINGIYRGILERVCTPGPLSVDEDLGLPTKRELSQLQLRHVLRLHPRWGDRARARAMSWRGASDDPGQSEAGGGGGAGYESLHLSKRCSRRSAPTLSENHQGGGPDTKITLTQQRR